MIAEDIMRDDFLAIDGNETVSRLIGQLLTRGERAAVVFDDDKYIGVVYPRLLIRSKLHAARMKVKKVCLRPKVLNGMEDVGEIVRFVYVSDSPLLPVVKGGVVGVVCVEDLLKLIRDEFKGVKVSDVMTMEAIVVKQNDRVGKAVEIMFEDKIERLPVVTPQGKLLGIVSLTDLMHKYYLNVNQRDRHGNSDNKSKAWGPDEVDMDAFPVKNYMTDLVFSVNKNTPVIEMIDKMLANNVLAVPVVDSGDNVVGFVSVRDLLKRFYVGLRPRLRAGL
ncbi:CBS domain-containing protein [Candidatus Woesearchaeota archaeon]|nr:CBS domain-containing protein [Candidatus Woesearchaeota archaeon]